MTGTTSVNDADSATSAATFVHLLRWRSEYQPDRRAFTFGHGDGGDEVHVTYAALDRSAKAIAALLQRETTEGDRVLLLYQPGLDYVAAFLGCLYAAVVAVPVYRPNPRLERTLPRLRAIVRNAGPAVVLTTSSNLPIGVQLAVQEELFAAARWWATDSLENAGAAAWHEPAVTGDTLAFLQYTSGSTTTPRGVMVSHRNLMHNESVIQHAAGLNADSVCVSWLPLYHDMGLIGCVLQPLYTGFPCMLMSPTDFLQKPVRWLQTITRERATASGAPNFAFDLCASQITPDERATLDLSSWKVAFNGAEPIRAETLDTFTAAFGPHGFRREIFLPCYGLAEATLLVSGGPQAAPPVLARVEKSALQRGRVAVAPEAGTEATTVLVGSGQVLPQQRVLLVDPETRLECAADVVGEIWVAGDGVACGYWNSPDATQETFGGRLADRDDVAFLRTGDLGFVYDEELFITSRLKDLIIIRGANHAPQDIEHTVEASHAALRPGCGAAFSIQGDGDEQLVVVHEVKRQFLDVDTEDVASAIRRAVAEEHELEVHAVVLLKTATLPKTSSGKVQRQACRNDFMRGGLQHIGQSLRPAPHATLAGSNPAGGDRPGMALVAVLETEPARRVPVVVAYLRRQIADAVGVGPEQVSLDQPFVALGLDSLRLLQLKQHIETDLGVEIPMERFLDHPSINELGVTVLDELDTIAGTLWADIAGLTDDEVDARLAQLSDDGSAR